MPATRTIDPREVSTSVFHSYMLGVVAPRPIAFASTVDKDGHVNLSPFSFFNAFGSNPPILVFSPARRVRDNTIKHTLENIYEVDEVVISIVNFAMVQQMSLASCEYDKGVNEFIKAGFTELPSTMVKPPRVAQSPAAFECKVQRVIETGTKGGAGNLVICEVLLVHIQENIFDETGQVDPQKLDPVARMGGNWYCRAHGEAIFEVPKPNQKKGIGVDQIPYSIRNSTILTGNDLGMLANIEELPQAAEVDDFRTTYSKTFPPVNETAALSEERLHRQAKALLKKGKLRDAWLTLLQTIGSEGKK